LSRPKYQFPYSFMPFFSMYFLFKLSASHSVCGTAPMKMKRPAAVNTCCRFVFQAKHELQIKNFAS
jgi:hypothetical protein